MTDYVFSFVPPARLIDPWEQIRRWYLIVLLSEDFPSLSYDFLQ